MKIIYIHKEEVHKRPPVISVISNLISLDQDVVLITCGINDNIQNKLENSGVEIHVLPYCKSNGWFGKLMEHIKFRKYSLKIINKHYGENTYLWVENGSAIVALGKSLLKYKYILQIQELFEKNKVTLRFISKVIGTASAVFVPEYNRAVLYQVWFGLQQRPYVLPNIPCFLPSDTDINSYYNKYANYIKKIEGKRVIIYQGYIGNERPLDCYVNAIKNMGEKYLLVLVGKDCGALGRYRQMLPSLIHIDYLPSPEYLFFTKYADVGIISYDPMILNNAYCAPNKVFEYATYGLPMLGNDIPGLKYLIEFYSAGKIIDEKNPENIQESITEIFDNYGAFSSNARKLIDSYDNRQMIKSVLDKLKSQ